MPKIHVDALIYEEEGVIVAHALQLDVVSTGTTKREAVNELLEACQAQITHAIENDNMENLFRPAPSDIWEKFFKAQEKVKTRKVSKPKSKAKRPTKFTPVSQLLAVPA